MGYGLVRPGDARIGAGLTAEKEAARLWRLLGHRFHLEKKKTR